MCYYVPRGENETVSTSEKLVAEHRNRERTHTPGWCRTQTRRGGDWDDVNDDNWGFCSTSCTSRDADVLQGRKAIKPLELHKARCSLFF